MNFLIVTIDALSKWYIDKIKKNNSFFSYMEKNTYCFSNMFSLGPFTEAAVRGYWSGDFPLKGYNYLSESHFENDTFFEEYSKSHYMYYGELIPYYNYKTKTDNELQREKCELRAFEHIWSARLEYYCGLFRSGNIKQNDYKKISFILDQYFQKYERAKAVASEKIKFESNKKGYINEILKEEKKCSLYRALNNNLLDSCKYRNITCIENQIKRDISADEALFIKKAKNKNIQIALANKFNKPDALESILNGEKNRCIISNNDLLAQMRDENEKLPKLKEEIDDFLSWYDTIGKELSVPFFAYIHNYDFHFPENFLNTRYEDQEEYHREVGNLIVKLDNLQNNNISVSKQLCLELIETNLKYFWDQLSKRNIFENTCVIFSADHGISNFMNPINKSNSRWNYTRTNFNVPLYIKAPNVENKIDYRMLCTNNFKQYLKDINSNKKIIEFNSHNQQKEYIYTLWINGIPEIDRSPIKIGIRDREWSITCEGLFSQSFHSLKILGIYDLTNDYDEINSVDYHQAIKDKNFNELYKAMGLEWYRQIHDLIGDEKVHKIYDNVIEFQEILSEYQDYFSDNKRTSKSEFLERLHGKKLIIYGCNQITVDLLGNIPDECELQEIWSDSNEPLKQYYGHKVVIPHSVDNADIVVNCSTNELQFLQMMKDNHISNYDNYLSII